MFNVKTIEQVTNTESKKKQIMENWNKYQYVVLSHNCYAFVMNKLDIPGLIECKDKNNCSKPQTGLASATKIEYYKGDRLSCENIMKRVIKDSHNTIYIPKHEPEKMINIEKIIYRKAHDCKKGIIKEFLLSHLEKIIIFIEKYPKMFGYTNEDKLKLLIQMLLINPFLTLS